MSAVEWFVVGVGPIVLLISLYLLILRQKKPVKGGLSARVNQLGHRLQGKISGHGSVSDPEVTQVTEQIMEALRESEEQPQRYDSSYQSSQLSSIHPLKESIAAVSKRLLKMEAQQAAQSDSQSLGLAALAVVYVRSHSFEVVRVEQIANELGVSTSKLYSCLKESLGCSVRELITVIKMQEAKRLLKSGDVLVKEVAFRLGFWSPYHFSKQFSLFFGLSPSQYKERQQHQRQQNDLKKPQRVIRTADGEDNPTSHWIDDSIDQKSLALENLPSGTAIDRFLIVNRIGRGGMGVVYKAYDPKLNRGVALKLISAEHERSKLLQHRLFREAQALARLSHPNVLHVYDVGTFGDKVFMTMALVEGQTLKEWLEAEKHSVNEILRVMIAAGRGLAAAHKAGLVHRDFKPSNVMIGIDGQVRVLDFGLARAVSSEEFDEDIEDKLQQAQRRHDCWEPSSEDSGNLLLTPLTHTGHVLGTPLYMAPEQHLGMKTDERTDQFGFCVVLYEALYGRRPFIARSQNELKLEVINQQVCVPSADSDVPQWLWQVIRKGLSASPKDRYESLESLLEVLDKDPLHDRLQKEMSRRRKVYLSALVLLTIALPIGVWYGLRYRTVQRCRAAQGEFEGVWDEKSRNDVRKAFLGLQKSFAKTTWERVEQTLNRYQTHWMQMRRDVCEARLLRASQSEELFDLRMSCLHKRIVELTALVRIFSQADAQVVQKAMEAASSLSNIAMCADEDALRATYPPPESEELKARVATIREQLAQVEAFSRTGKYREGLELVEKLENEAKAISYLPVQAEKLYLLGRLHEKTGDYEAAETNLFDAAQAANECGDNLLAARAMALLAFVVGCRQSRHREGLSLARAAQVVLGSGKKNETIQAEIQDRFGGVFWSQGDYSNSLVSYRRSLALREKLLSDDHPDVALTLNNIGMVLDDQGQKEKALEYLRRSLAITEKALGPEHPLVAMMLNNIGIVLRENREYNEALEVHLRALAIREKALGVAHRYVATSLNNIGLLFNDLGKFDKAREYFEKALAIWKKALGPSHPYLAYPLSGLGLVSRGLGKSEKALDYHHKALVIWEAATGSDHPFVAQSLGYIGSIYFDQRRPQKALKPLERAMSICDKKTCAPDSLGLILFTLAQALWQTDGDKERSIKLARQAVSVFDKVSSQDKEEQQEKVNTWLQKHTVEKLAKRTINVSPR